MKKIILILVLITSLIAQASHGDSLQTSPFQVSFFYPLGTHGIESPKYINQISFNILYGINGGLDGVEVGGLVNTNLGSARGVQIAGIANINAAESNGLMIGGITNIIKDTSNSICIAGISNIIGGNGIGLQLAGISNTVNGNFMGSQIAGIANINNGDMFGFQASGISNLNNGYFSGLQVAGISNVNIGDMEGTQIGFINRATNIKGFQLGFINVANSFENGVPLGFISIVKDGYHALELSTTDAIYANLNLKLGVRKLYNIFKFGFAANSGNHYMTYGIGLGTMIDFMDKFAFSIDGSSNHIVGSWSSPNLDLLNNLDLAFRYSLNNHFSLFAGPTIYVYVAQHNVDTESPALQVPYSIYQTNWGNQEGSTSIWIGGNAGVSLSF